MWIEPHWEFKYKNKYSWADVKDAARKALPQLRLRGVLKVREG